MGVLGMLHAALGSMSVRRIFFPGVGKLGSGDKSPQWSPGMEPQRGLGRSTQKPTTYCQNNA